MDRFMMQLAMGYPTPEEELQIMDRYIAGDPWEEVGTVCTGAQILEMREICRQVYVSGSVRKYITQIVQATREHAGLALGVNPRGTLALVHAAQAYAAIRGREFVTPDDIKELCVPVLGHRLLSYTTTQSQSVNGMLEEILQKIPVPTEAWS